MQLESLSPEQIQTAADQALRLTLEATMFARFYHSQGERPPDLGPEMATALGDAIQTLNVAVKLGFSPNATIHGEVEQHMQDEAWRSRWLERHRLASYT